MKTVTWKLLAVALLLFFTSHMVMARPLESATEEAPVPSVFSTNDPLHFAANPNPPSGPIADMEGDGYYREIASWDFESGDLWTPKYRQGSVLPGGAYWHADSFEGYSGTNSWWCGVMAPTITYNGYANNWLQHLDTPVLDLTSSGTTGTLSFMMKAYLEGGAYHPLFDSWDAFTVFYSTDGGATFDVLTSPSTAYNSSSNYAFGQLWGFYYEQDGTTYGTPVPGWYGNITGGNYINVTFDVTSLLNETNVVFRFSFASDGSESAQNYSAYKGVHLDDISVVDDIGGIFLSNNADGVAIPSDLIPQEQIESEWELTESESNSATHSWHMANDANVKHSLVSPQFYLPNTSNPVYMSYYVHCDMPDANGDGAGALDDYYQLLISINNGASWYNLGHDWSTRPNYYGESGGGWVYRDDMQDSGAEIIDLSTYKGYNVTLAFLPKTDHNEDGGVGTGLFIDDVTVYEYEGFYDYIWEPTDYNWIELADDPDAQYIHPTSSTQRWSLDFSTTHSFEFAFQDKLFTQGRVGASGTIFFSGSSIDFPQHLTDYSTIANTMSVLRVPLEFQSRDDAGIYIKNVDGVLVVEWFAAHLENSPTWPVMVQAHCYASGEIEYHYQIVPYSLPELNNFTVGVNNSDRSMATELWPEMDVLPLNETAFRFIPGVPSYGHLDVTVIDEETNEVVPDLELYIPRFSQYAYTDENGQVFFDYVPLHVSTTVNVELLGDYYVHQVHSVEVQPNTTTEDTMYVHAIMREVQNFNADNNSESEVTLWWNYPDVYYNMTGLELYSSDTWSWYTFEDDCIAQGCDYSGYQLDGVFDIEEVSFYLQNRQRYWYDSSHQPDIQVDVWDMTDPENPVSIFQTLHNPSSSYGWCTVPIGLYGLQDPNFAVTLTTPGYSGYYAYSLYYDQTNNWASDVIVSDVHTPDQEFHFATMPGDAIMSVVVSYNGSVWDPVPPGPDGADNSDLAEILEGHEGYYRLGQSRSQPVELVNRAPENRNPDTGSLLDEYDGVVDHYDIYQDDVLIGSTSGGYDYEYVADGLDETMVYDFYIVPVYQYDAQLIDGPPSPVISISPVMPPDMPMGDAVVLSNETTAGGDITLSWTPPEYNMDGSAVNDLVGFNLYLNGDFSVPVVSLSVEVTSHDITGATRDFYNYYITAIDDAGNESQPYCFGYSMVGTPDAVIDFEADGGGFNTSHFTWGVPVDVPETSFNGDPTLWGTNLEGYYDNRQFFGLSSVSLHVDAPEAWVTFGTWYDFEYGYDGGVVLVSTDNGENWEIVDMAQDASLYSDPFWGAQFENPVSYYIPDGHGLITGYSGDAWNGTPEGWRFLGVDLNEYVGMDIVLGFFAGTDVANALYYGWYIDDIGLHNVSLSPMGSLSGIVTDSDDVPLEHALISIPGRSVQTDATGAYSIADILVGDYTANCWKQGYNEVDVQVTIVQDTDTQQDFSMTYPVLNTNGVTDITLDVFPGFTGTYTMSITNDGSGPLMVRPDTHGDIPGYDATESSSEFSSWQQPGGEPVSDDYALPLGSFSIPYPLMSMNGITIDEISGNLLITDKQTSGIFIVNPESGYVVDQIPTPYAPADGEDSPFPGSVEFHGPDLWFSWHEILGPNPSGTGPDKLIRTHIVRIIDFETGAYDVEFISTDMGWNGFIRFFEFMPDYNGIIFTGYNYDLETSAFAFTSPAFTQTDDFVTPEVTIVRTLQNSRPQGLELGADGNLWLIGSTDADYMPALLYQVTMPDMTVMAEISIEPDASTVAGLDIDPEGHFMVVDANRAYLIDAGFGHPYFSTLESRYYFSPAMTGDIVFDVNIPEMAMVGDVYELLLALHNNGMPYEIEIPVVLNVNEPVWTHDIPLQAGWNLSSINLMPIDPSADMQLPAMFGAEIDAGNLVLIKDNDGNIFDPVSGLNQIGAWDPLQGYKINVINPTSVPVSGYIFDMETPIDLFTGWNMISYLPQEPINTWEAVSSIMNQVIIVKDGHGNFFMPAYGYNGIGNMMPMYGYQVKVTGNSTLYYPFTGPRLSDPVEPAKATQHFTTSISESGPSYSLLITDSDIDGDQLSANDEIAIYDDRGRIVSSGVWGENGMVGLPVWIDDQSTETAEGVAEGGRFSVQIWLADEDIMIPASLEYIEGDREVKGNGYQVASVSGSILSVIPGQFFLSQNYPNPFNPSTTIKYGLPEDAFVELEIFNVLGQTVRTLAREEKQAGYYTILWDGLDNSGRIVSSGTYFYRLRAGEFTQMHRMVVTK